MTVLQKMVQHIKQFTILLISRPLAAIVQSQAASLGITDTVTAVNVNTYVAKLGTQASALTAQAEKQAEKTAKEQAKKQLNALPKDVKDAIDNASKLKAYQALLKEQGQEKAAKQLTKKNLKSLYDIVEVRIPQIDTALGNLKTEITVAKKVLKQVEKSIKSAEDKYEEVEQGKISAAAAFGTANAQINSAQSSLASSEKSLHQEKNRMKNQKRKH